MSHDSKPIGRGAVIGITSDMVATGLAFIAEHSAPRDHYVPGSRASSLLPKRPPAQTGQGTVSPELVALAALKNGIAIYRNDHGARKGLVLDVDSGMDLIEGERLETHIAIPASKLADIFTSRRFNVHSKLLLPMGLAHYLREAGHDFYDSFVAAMDLGYGHRLTWHRSLAAFKDLSLEGFFSDPEIRATFLRGPPLYLTSLRRGLMDGNFVLNPLHFQTQPEGDDNPNVKLRLVGGRVTIEPAGEQGFWLESALRHTLFPKGPLNISSLRPAAAPPVAARNRQKPVVDVEEVAPAAEDDDEALPMDGPDPDSSLLDPEYDEDGVDTKTEGPPLRIKEGGKRSKEDPKVVARFAQEAGFSNLRDLKDEAYDRAKALLDAEKLVHASFPGFSMYELDLQAALADGRLTALVYFIDNLKAFSRCLEKAKKEEAQWKQNGKLPPNISKDPHVIILLRLLFKLSGEELPRALRPVIGPPRLKKRPPQGTSARLVINSLERLLAEHQKQGTQLTYAEWEAVVEPFRGSGMNALTNSTRALFAGYRDLVEEKLRFKFGIFALGSGPSQVEPVEEDLPPEPRKQALASPATAVQKPTVQTIEKRTPLSVLDEVEDPVFVFSHPQLTYPDYPFKDALGRPDGSLSAVLAYLQSIGFLRFEFTWSGERFAPALERMGLNADFAKSIADVLENYMEGFGRPVAGLFLTLHQSQTEFVPVFTELQKREFLTFHHEQTVPIALTRKFLEKSGLSAGDIARCMDWLDAGKDQDHPDLWVGSLSASFWKKTLPFRSINGISLMSPIEKSRLAKTLGLSGRADPVRRAAPQLRDPQMLMNVFGRALKAYLEAEGKTDLDGLIFWVDGGGRTGEKERIYLTEATFRELLENHHKVTVSRNIAQAFISYFDTKNHQLAEEIRDAMDAYFGGRLFWDCRLAALVGASLGEILILNEEALWAYNEGDIIYLIPGKGNISKSGFLFSRWKLETCSESSHYYVALKKEGTTARIMGKGVGGISNRMAQLLVQEKIALPPVGQATVAALSASTVTTRPVLAAAASLDLDGEQAEEPERKDVPNPRWSLSPRRKIGLLPLARMGGSSNFSQPAFRVAP